MDNSYADSECLSGPSMFQQTFVLIFQLYNFTQLLISRSCINMYKILNDTPIVALGLLPLVDPTPVRPYASHPGGGGVWTWMGGTQARIQDFLKGWVKIFTSTPPLGHCPRDVIHPPENWKTPPLLDIHKHHHPLGHCPRDVIRPLGHSQAPHPTPPWTLPVWRHPHSRGGWSVPVTHTLHRFSVSGQVQGGGGVIIPVTNPPPPWIRHWNTKYRVWLGCLYHGRNKFCQGV